MSISVIIPCHNGIEDTRACLRSLRDQLEPSLEVLLVDNGSQDGSHRLDREFPGLRVLRQGRNLGFAGGINQGLRAAKGECLLILNNDTLVGERMIPRLRAALDSDPSIAIAAPVSNHVKGTAQIAAGSAGLDAATRREIEDLLDHYYGGYLQDRCSLSGLCLMFRPALLDQIGLFDERFGTGNFEDDDFCLRARLQGHRLIIVRNAFLHHHGHRTFVALGIDYSASLDQRERIFADKWSKLAAGRVILAQIKNDPELAAKESRLALEESPLWPDAHLNLARHELNHDDYAAAKSHLSSFLDRCPNHGEALLMRACATIGLGQESDGLRLFAEILESEPLSEQEHAVGLTFLARILIKRGKAADAVPYLEVVLELAPEQAEAHNLLGIAYLAAGDAADATKSFEKAFALGEENASHNLAAMKGYSW